MRVKVVQRRGSARSRGARVFHERVRIQLKAERPNAANKPMWILCRKQRISLDILLVFSVTDFLKSSPKGEVDTKGNCQCQERKTVTWRLSYRKKGWTNMYF